MTIAITETTWQLPFNEWYANKIKGIYTIDEDYEK